MNSNRYRNHNNVKCILFFLTVINFSCGFTTVEKQDYEWQITFEDNFDTYDRTKWINMHDNGNRTIWSNNESEWYKDENVSVENGILKLSAKKESIYGKDIESEKQFEYTSGMICNAKSFTQAYGKWEMRVKFPFKHGYWPAFFLVPKQRPSLPEIDVFEYFGINEDKIYTTHHWGLDYKGPGTGNQGEPFYYVKNKEITGDFSDKWMVWSFECFPDKMIWKLDGKIVFEATDGIPTAPLYMIANVAVKDHKENDFGIDDTGLPYVMEIDYVRVYKMVPKK
ncbi:MAG TPA: glycoside hydrolase family 16 protein [Ignavibacteria bacterium]|nr:glycoside hydrolase family 16 protein [Ignavibacteria bacterium]HMR40228.1 glycoside hydrolase family 16 protein [Ignavibacteria bacterium]